MPDVAARTLDWQQQAACRNPDRAADFYPPMRAERKHERRAREHRAKLVCASCPVQPQCLHHAVACDERYGVWGGLTQDERRTMQATA